MSIESLFNYSVPLDPDRVEDALSRIPARWCVALLCGENDRCVQLVAFKNLRATLRRRLTEPEEGVKGKRIDYRQLVRSIHWTRVDGALEMDVLFAKAARAAFPDRWRSLVPQRSAWFVHVDPEERFPDHRKVEAPQPAGFTFGPFLSGAKADGWIDRVRDGFDLCRFYNILRQAPNGRACAYKEMGKCPAPCDGSIEIDAYREQIRASVRAVIENDVVLKESAEQMKQHAAKLEFEKAAAIKTRMKAIEDLVNGGGGLRIAPVGNFRFLAIGPGPRKGTAKVFDVGPDWFDPVACLMGELGDSSSLVRETQSTARFETSLIPDHLAMVCHHLAAPKTRGRLLPVVGSTPKSLNKCIREVMSLEEEPSGAEEIVRETQVLVS